jgi:serine/threonine-protein kinase
MSGLTMSGETGGTPQFMPPEQVLNFRAVKPAGDQYAAAATLYFLLTGKPPYDATKNVQDFFKRILQDEPVRIETRRADLPKELANILHRALAREPGQRFADVLGLRRALLPFGQ